MFSELFRGLLETISEQSKQHQKFTEDSSSQHDKKKVYGIPANSLGYAMTVKLQV